MSVAISLVQEGRIAETQHKGNAKKEGS
jgi:hypothetical protein